MSALERYGHGEINFSQEKDLGRLQVLTVGINSGAGHLTQAERLARELSLRGLKARFSEFNQLVRDYASTAEQKILDELDWYNRIFFTQHLAKILPAAGYHLLNNLTLKLPFRAGPPLTWPLEQQLAIPLAKALAGIKADVLVATHPIVARIGLTAKNLKLLAQDFPIFSISCDHLLEAPEIVHQIYNHVCALGGDVTQDYILVTSQKAVEEFAHRGHPREIFQIVNPEYILSAAEAAVVERKQERLSRIAAEGLSETNPLVLAFVQDNFDTRPEGQAAYNTAMGYARELAERKLVSLFLVPPTVEEKITNKLIGRGFPQERLASLRSPEELEQFFLSLENNQQPSVVFVSKDNAAWGDGHTEFGLKQELLLLFSHLVVSRPSEIPRDAACFGTPTLLTTPFGPVEKEMKKFNEREGISLPWVVIDRYRASSAVLRLSLGYPYFDLADPKTHQLLLQMSQGTLTSKVRQPLTGIVESILANLKQPLSYFETIEKK